MKFFPIFPIICTHTLLHSIESMHPPPHRHRAPVCSLSFADRREDLPMSLDASLYAHRPMPREYPVYPQRPVPSVLYAIGGLEIFASRCICSAFIPMSYCVGGPLPEGAPCDLIVDTSFHIASRTGLHLINCFQRTCAGKGDWPAGAPAPIDAPTPPARGSYRAGRRGS